jgi:hypothetical protein
MGMNATDSGSNPDDPRENSLADEDWTRFRARVDREWRQQRRAADADDFGGPPSYPGRGEGTGYHRVNDFDDRLFSGPGAELFGGREAGTASGEYTAYPAPGPGQPSNPGFAGHPSLPDIPPVPASRSIPPPPPASPAETSGLVRPYFRTKGRTKPTYDLAIEALVSTSERGRALDRVTVPEHRSICGLCLDTRSVAEVAAYLRLPLGVVRVLIGDVAGLGLVLVHTATAAVGDRPSIEFMERVLSGLRRI